MGRCRIVFLLMGIIFTFYACDFPSLVGVDFVEEDPLTITYYDTVSIKISTVKFDSLATSNISRLLIGKSKDERLGSITAKAFFQVGRDSLNSYPDEEKAEYDSLSLEMVFDGYSYYDTTQLQTFYLYSLLDEMELGDDGRLYNTSNCLYGLDSIYFLGKISFFPRVRKDKPEYLRIDDDFGKALFELLKTKDEILENNNDFREYIKGFAIIPDSTNTCVIGLNNETSFKLFYSQEGAQAEQVFPIANNIYFSQVSAQVSDSIFNTLATQKDILSSAEVGDLAFIQGGVGLGIRVEFPYLDYVRELSENNLVTDAELILKPVKHSYSGLSMLPANLIAYKVDKYNNIISEPLIESLLYYDDEYNEETFYSININSFLEEQLGLLENDGSALLFTLTQSDNSGTVNRLYIGDESHDSKSYLRLIIMNINETF